MIKTASFQNPRRPTAAILKIVKLTYTSSSRLRLNPAKTVVISLGGRQQVANITVDSIPVLSSMVTTVASARDLGVVVDS